jgi:hypothetical protein
MNTEEKMGRGGVRTRMEQRKCILHRNWIPAKKKNIKELVYTTIINVVTHG